MDAKFVSVYINQLGKTFRAGFGTPEDLAAGRLAPDLDGLAAFEDAQAAEYLRLNPPPPPEPEPEPEADDAPDYYVDPDPITVLSEIDLGTGSEG